MSAEYLGYAVGNLRYSFLGFSYHDTWYALLFLVALVPQPRTRPFFEVSIGSEDVPVFDGFDTLQDDRADLISPLLM